MASQLTLLYGLSLIGCFSWLVYKIEQNQSNRLLKYIPAIASAVGIAFYSIKLQFISTGFEGINDMIIIIFLAISCCTSLIVALVLELINKRRRNVLH
ncbi:hypothetical protein [Alkalihalobacterium chitinilyticum]|uniref:Uncharacterized protein n=1 Tax=Alkalihalobacterium chitinilyticum TaxID=2980103 RepID=A0ABT5VDU9_9BACI|nr:hypothetical protein [Alkalihalobacterium chitinilyticum]MDE5413636.1 hypothetical protein [Alkalihalobacterium chitinilyticum]